jgi:hypothetical protein
MGPRLREGDAAGSGFAQRAQHGPRGAANRAQQGRQTTPSQPSPHSAQVDGNSTRTAAIGRRRSANGKLGGRRIGKRSGRRRRSVIGLLVDKQVHCRHYLI